MIGRNKTSITKHYSVFFNVHLPKRKSNVDGQCNIVTQLVDAENELAKMIKGPNIKNLKE